MKVPKTVKTSTLFTFILGTLVILILMSVSFLAGMKYKAVENYQKAYVVLSTSPTPTANTCVKNGEGKLTDDILVSYRVRKGDTLVSISQKELGDPSRYMEIARLNNDMYPHLVTQSTQSYPNPKLVVGWELKLPPSWIKKSSGSLQVINGLVFNHRLTDGAYEISRNANSSGRFTSLDLAKFSSNFKVGDCISIVQDLGDGTIIQANKQ